MDVPDKRRIEIKKLLLKNNSVSVSNLAKIFNVSELTIRRDLKRLKDEGFLERVHGGAISNKIKAEFSPVFLEDLKQFKEEKQNIAKEAAKRISNGNAIILESGTSCLELVYHLENVRDIFVYTASVPIAYELWKIALNRQDIEVNICGGQVEIKSNTLIGSNAVNFFKDIHVDIAFIGAIAVSLKSGITTNSILDAEVTRAIAANSGKIILLSDSSKFGKNSHISIIGLKSINEIITDKGISSEIAEGIRKLGVKLTIV
ncbi:MAG: DeoR/GlpR family DNA-binding transcription regulator [Actinobacteria bacterium]|nr:DeoR/GlpR family DNA-binding transcription regulator [Actinomycetota bacterium]